MNGNGAKIWGFWDIFAGASADAGDRLLKRLFTEFAHLVEDDFQFAMVGDCLFVKAGLDSRKRQADGSGPYFARQPPCMWRLRHEAVWTMS